MLSKLSIISGRFFFYCDKYNFFLNLVKPNSQNSFMKLNYLLLLWNQYIVHSH